MGSVVVVPGARTAPQTASTLARALRSAGVDRVAIQPPDQSGPPEPADLVIQIDGPFRYPDRGPTAVLRVGWEDDCVHIGPQLRAPYTACASCVRRSVHEAGLRLRPDPPAAFADLSGDWIAAEAARVLSRDYAATPPRVLRRIRPDGRVARHLVVPYHGCRQCRWAAADGDLLAVYEWQVERPPVPLLTSLPAIRAMSARALGEAVEPPSVWRGPLPAPAPWQPLPADGGRLTLPVLARLLVSAAGRRFLDSDRRWSPSGGNLGSISAWLVHGFGAGLPAAPLRLDDRTAELVARTAEPLLPGELLAATDLEAPAAGAVVVLVVELSRVLTKYGRFAYRLVHLDSGCAALQLGLVAQEYGLEVHFASRWDGTVGPRLGLDPAREAIVAIATVAIAVLEEG